MNDIVTDSRLVSYVLNMCIKCKKYGTPFESRVADTVLKQNTWVTKKQWHIVAIGANKKPKAAGGYQHPDAENNLGRYSGYGWF